MYYHNFYTVDPFEPTAVEFDVWSSKDVRKLSVVKISTYIAFDGLGYPVVGGLYDARLGPLKFNSDPCATCGNNMMKCSGHFGHIELPFPVFNPLFIDIVGNILKLSCLHCYTVLIPDIEKYVLIAQLKLIIFGCLTEVYELDQYLQNNSYKQPIEIRNEMIELCKNKLHETSTNTPCKYADDLWRLYVNKLFRKGSHVKACFNCKKMVSKITFERGRFVVHANKRSEMKEKIYLLPLNAMEHMRKLWQSEKDLLQTLIRVLAPTDESPTDVCFTSVVLVTPSNTRPVQTVNDKPLEHPKNTMYKLILQDCLQIQSILRIMNKGESKEEVSKEVIDIVNVYRGNTINEKLHNAWYSLQISVNSLLDSTELKTYMNANVGISKIGLKQLIEKKEGIIRKNMMGKRVDFFARSVITPDPMLSIDEIGVPDTFAKKLTFPVPVTPWNVDELRKMVLNGPEIYPGANIVESDTGAVVWVSGTNSESRKGLAKTLLTPDLDSKGPKVVHRHLLDGDTLLLNRQPSLHKPSIMAHKAHILKGEKTFRLHYANCKAYNADFDGDEMNAHLPQGELARAEASEIVSVPHQYLVPRDGTPLSGLIQDHVISAFRLSIRDKFFNRSEYHQLIFQALCFLINDIKILPPAILKPKQLWSGKQVISTVIINLIPKDSTPLNLTSKAKIGYNVWPQQNNGCDYMTSEEQMEMSETRVIIRNGELLCGILDKNHVGSTHYGLIHYFYELYGGVCSANLLSAFSKLFTYYLQTDGFTLGVLDILVRKKPDRKRHKIADKIKTAGIEAVKNALNIPSEEMLDEEKLSQLLEIAYKKNSNFQASIDYQYKIILDQYTNEINKICLPNGLLQPFPANNLQLMVQSGAKGSTVNTMQISCALGQIELEGKRPPLMISGKSLPSFPPYDPSPMAGGFIVSRFMTGLQPQEFFFHCMAGREGLIDTAVKTSRSGYLQRCLIKHLEGLIINYDLTVRDTDNSIIQFQYGEDGLDILKSQLLKPDQMNFFVDNVPAFYDKKNMKSLKKHTSESCLKNVKSSISSEFGKNDFNLIKRTKDSGFLRFCRDVTNDVQHSKIDKILPGRTVTASKLCYIWQTMLHDETKTKYEKMCNQYPDPVLSMFQPDLYFGSISEKLENTINAYSQKNTNRFSFKRSKFKDVVYWKSFLSLCQPGEAVGVLAAQSIGEPSTQMTLNTFHFAGRGEMNVTLGIPRLREILMVASKDIKTPSMEIPFRTDVLKVEKKAEKLRKTLTQVVLKDVLEKIVVKEFVRIKSHIRVYQLHLHYLPKKSYSNNTNVTPQFIIKYVENEFVIKLDQMLKKYLRQNYSSNLVTETEQKERNERKNLDDKNSEENNVDKDLDNENNLCNKNANSDDESDIEGDGDATEAKLKNRQSDIQDYDDENGDEEGIFDESNFNESDQDEEGNLFDSETNEFFTKDNKGSVAQKYGVKHVEHDLVNFNWSKITLWSSLSYKSLDLSSLLPNIIERAVIYEIPGIKRAITYVNNDGCLTLKTEGSRGMRKLFEYDRLLDLNKLYSNDVHVIAETYGIEAANRVIVREIQDVFKVYGITVDPRHLLLVADYMTFNGTYQPLNRKGMDNCPSPLQQMTFESTLKYLKNATMRKLKDNLQSPSSCLIIGKETKVGSGLIQVYNK